MYQLINLFPTPLYQEQIDKNILLSLKQEILKYIETDSDKFKSNWNCNTKSNMGTGFEQDSRSKNLKNIILSSSKKFLNECEIKYKNILIEGLWINISPLGAHQESHSHITHTKNNVFSGVLYIITDDISGDLILNSPNKIHNNLFPPCKYSLDNMIITPQEGLLISFPSYLIHEVCPNNSNQTRISVSWNIYLDN